MSRAVTSSRILVLPLRLRASYNFSRCNDLQRCALTSPRALSRALHTHSMRFARGHRRYFASIASDEVVALVDEHNNVIGPEKRAKVRGENLRHRGTYIFAFNSKKQLAVQKRTMIKDYCPGYYDTTAGGVVQHGETYEENAYREAEEEFGIKGLPLKHHTTFYYEDARTRCFGDIWSCTYDGPLILQKEEVESVRYLTIAEIFKEHADGEKYCPDSIAALRELVKSDPSFE